jgi:protein-tyrosine-phosphatase
MAEGFARKYGSDVLYAASAGLGPAMVVAPMTVHTMKKRNIDVSAHFPKAISEAPGGPFDEIINMSGYPLTGELRKRGRIWSIDDPIGMKEEFYDQVADKIEKLVMQLIMELRTRVPVDEKAVAAETQRRRARLGDPRSRK